MQKPSILLIDDCAMMRQFIALFLSQKYHVTDCATAEEALRLAECGFRPRLVITDLELPGMSGIELIRNFQLTMPFTPLVVVSSAKESKARIEALSAGADDFLSKPFHPAELDIRIGKLRHRGEASPAKMPAPSNFWGNFRQAAAAIF